MTVSNPLVGIQVFTNFAAAGLRMEGSIRIEGLKKGHAFSADSMTQTIFLRKSAIRLGLHEIPACITLHRTIRVSIPPEGPHDQARIPFVIGVVRARARRRSFTGRR